MGLDMKSEREAKEDSIMIGQIILLGAALSLALSLQGCGISASIYGIDKVKHVEQQVEKPWYCRYISCEAKNDK